MADTDDMDDSYDLGDARYVGDGDDETEEDEDESEWEPDREAMAHDADDRDDENWDEDDDDDDDDDREEDADDHVLILGPTAAAPSLRSQERARQLLSAASLRSIERVFAGQPYAPMRFVRTANERRQQRELPNERIAHQLRAYELGSRAEDPESGTDEPTTATSTSSSPPLSSSPPIASMSPSSLSPSTKPARPPPRHRGRQLFHALRQREQCGRNSKAQLVRLQETFLPFQEHKHCRVVDYVGERLYCGGFDSTGRRFLVAGQLAQILVYDTQTWTRAALLPAREVQWTVTDAKFTPDDRHVLYASINSNVRMVSVDYDRDQHEEVFPLLGTHPRRGHGRCGVWALDVNAAGTEFVAGTSSNEVVLYDMATRTAVSHVEGHDDDVNAMAFVDGPLRTNVFVSGSDDALIKVWDRRVLSAASPRAQGVFPGHCDGLTHISARDDGYYFLSNAKDQTCKLWDLRKCQSSRDHARARPFRKPYHWDYRFQEYPGLRKFPVGHPQDRSVMTYRGHLVMETLVRCHFSPLHSTGQKYIYTGSADGRVYVYDTLTGHVVEVFAMKPDGLTRDVRWHPHDPTIVSPDFYGKLCVWERHE